MAFVRGRFGDPAAVAVELWRDLEGRILGNIRLHGGFGPAVVSDDMDAGRALWLAEREAKAIGRDVLVIDPRDLWEGIWGTLTSVRHRP